MAVNNFNYIVSWSDFVQVPAKGPGVTEDAEIKLRFPQSYDYTMGKKIVKIVNPSVAVRMDSPECWVLTSQASNMDLLKHEQGHYDITAIGAREFHDKIDGLTAANEDALNAKVARIRADIQRKIDRVNLNYDEQTEHSLKKDVQLSWDKKIDTAKKNPRALVTDLQ